MTTKAERSQETPIERAAALMAANDGRLTPDAVLADAQDTESPLHRLFTWDNEKAGHLYRLDEARAFIRSIKVEVTVFSKSARVPAYVRDPEAGRDQGYVSVAAIRKDEDYKREAFLLDLRRAGWALARSQTLAEYFGLSDQLKHVVAGITDIEAALP